MVLDGAASTGPLIKGELCLRDNYRQFFGWWFVKWMVFKQGSERLGVEAPQKCPCLAACASPGRQPSLFGDDTCGGWPCQSGHESTGYTKSGLRPFWCEPGLASLQWVWANLWLQSHCYSKRCELRCRGRSGRWCLGLVRFAEREGQTSPWCRHTKEVSKFYVKL